MNKKPYIVGIAGCSGSGKTTVIKRIFSNMPKGSVAIVSQDNYYKDIEEQHVDHNGVTNFDLPSSIDKSKFIEDMTLLANDNVIVKEEYHFNNPEARPSQVKIEPAPIIIMEGLFICHYQEIFNKLDLLVFIDAPQDTMLKRRIIRDDRERGYDEKSVRYQWDNHVWPSFMTYLNPYSKAADIVINNYKDYKKGLEILMDHLKAKIN